MLPSSMTSSASSSSPKSPSITDRFMAARPRSTSRRTSHDIGAT
jgi:hypothetical protein